MRISIRILRGIPSLSLIIAVALSWNAPDTRAQTPNHKHYDVLDRTLRC
jgi:hypothetical protein